MSDGAADTDRSSRIHFHYIGGRAGAHGPFFLKAHADEMLFHIYDGDPDCLAQIAADPMMAPFSFKIASVIFTRTAGPTFININFDPFTSSCLDVNEALASGYCVQEPLGDYVMGQACRTVRRVEGVGQTLDDVAASGDGIDFLTMDTQGSELDILTGGPETVERRLVGFISEVEFEEIYKGQPLFGDIHAWAIAQGFRLMKLDVAPVGWSRHRPPIGWRGGAAALFGDALYLKAPARIIADHADPVDSLAKSVFIALALGQIDHVAECLALSPDDMPTPTPTAPRYRRLFHEIAAIHKRERERGLMPPCTTDTHSAESSAARFAADTPLTRQWDTNPEEIRKRYFAHTDKALFLRELPRLLSAASTPFEATLAAYDFKRAAALVRANRLKHAALLCRALGLGDVTGEETLVDLDHVIATLA